MNNEIKCWNVKCRTEDGSEYDVGVMCADEVSARRCAEYSLKEGRHIRASAFLAEETDTI